jgi:hypothetical protein
MARAVFIDKARADAANNPFTKATATSSPIFSQPVRLLVRSVEPDLPMLPQSPLRMVRVLSATPENRAAAVAALGISRVMNAEWGYTAAGYLIEIAGPTSDLYAYSVAMDSFVDVENYAQKVASMTPRPGALSDLTAKGTIVLGARRIDTRMDLG